MARVHGASMAPTLREGDRVLVVHGRRVRPGDVVVGELADGTVAVKRAVERRTTASGASGWWLLSEPISLAQIAGAGLVLIGVLLVSQR